MESVHGRIAAIIQQATLELDRDRLTKKLEEGE